MHGPLRNYDPIRQKYIFYPLTKIFDVEESRPLIIPHDIIQPIEVLILEFFHNTKHNQKLNNLIQNTSHEFSLELLWPLLQNKYVIRMLAKLRTSSDTIRANFADDHSL